MGIYRGVEKFSPNSKGDSPWILIWVEILENWILDLRWVLYCALDELCGEVHCEAGVFKNLHDVLCSLGHFAIFLHMLLFHSQCSTTIQQLLLLSLIISNGNFL